MVSSFDKYLPAILIFFFFFFLLGHFAFQYAYRAVSVVTAGHNARERYVKQKETWQSE